VALVWQAMGRIADFPTLEALPAHDADAMIGSTLAHYRVTAALGAGGMGEVYRATDSTLGRDVASRRSDEVLRTAVTAPVFAPRKPSRAARPA
jgi:serine/threonine protein kinase